MAQTFVHSNSLSNCNFYSNRKHLTSQRTISPIVPRKNQILFISIWCHLCFVIATKTTWFEVERINRFIRQSNYFQVIVKRTVVKMIRCCSFFLKRTLNLFCWIHYVNDQWFKGNTWMLNSWFWTIEMRSFWIALFIVIQLYFVDWLSSLNPWKMTFWTNWI